MLKAKDAQFVYNPGFIARSKRGRAFNLKPGIKVVPRYAKDDGWPRDWVAWCPATGHGLDAPEPKTPKECFVVLLNIFNQLTVRDKLSPAVVHEAFMQIEEYNEYWTSGANGASGL
jgi:hypothetical protein